MLTAIVFRNCDSASPLPAGNETLSLRLLTSLMFHMLWPKLQKSSQQMYRYKDKKDLDLLFQCQEVQAAPEPSPGTGVTSTTDFLPQRSRGTPDLAKYPWKRHVGPLLGVSIGEEPTRGCSIKLCWGWLGRTSSTGIQARTTGTTHNQLILCYLKRMREEKLLVRRAPWARAHLKPPRQNTHHIVSSAVIIWSSH